MQRYSDRNKAEIVHKTARIRPSSIRLVLSGSATHEFKGFSHDVTQAYLQSKDRLRREIYLQVKPQDRDIFGINENELVKIEKPLYGICDSGDYWGVMINAHVVNDLGMVTILNYSAL